MPGALPLIPYASRVTGALLLPVSLLLLVLLPRASGWWVHLSRWGCLCCRHCCCWGRVVVGVARVAGASAVSGVVGFPGTTAVDRGLGCGHLHGWRGHRPRCHCCLIPCGCGCCCSQEAGVMCAASPAVTGFSGAAGSATVAGSRDYKHHLCFPLSSASSVCSSPPTFRCTNVWNSPAFQCVGQMNLS